jgi:RNA polymerase sigma-70 factor (ECF subfamily)
VSTHGDDETLMRGYVTGDSEAFETLYARHSGRVYAYLRKKLSSPQEVDEVFQTCFLKFHQSRFQYDPKYPVAQWLYVIAKTTLVDYFRKAGRQVAIADDVPFDEVLGTQVSQKDPLSALNELTELEVLEDLPPEQRKALEMRILEELSYEQIAARLGKSPVGVRQLVSRGLKKIRTQFARSL